MNTPDLRRRAEQLRGQLPERRQSRPPPESGKRLATLSRSKDEELRVNRSTYEGKPFLSIRLGVRNDDGQWWPSKAVGCTVRLRELADVAEAIDLAEEHQRGR